MDTHTLPNAVVLVCGGRDYTDYAAAAKALDYLRTAMELRGIGRITDVIHGAARGADTLAARWATESGTATRPLKIHSFPADWNTHGKRAGYLRNRDMLTFGLALREKEGHYFMVVAFPGGVGTRMMCDLAQKAGVPVYRPYGA